MCFQEGMEDFTENLRQLAERGDIEKTVALEFSPNPDQLKMMLKGIKVCGSGYFVGGKNQRAAVRGRGGSLMCRFPRYLPRDVLVRKAVAIRLVGSSSLLHATPNRGSRLQPVRHARGERAMPPNEPCPHCSELILDWHNEWYDGAQRRAIYIGLAAMDCPLCRQPVLWLKSRDVTAPAVNSQATVHHRLAVLAAQWAPIRGISVRRSGGLSHAPSGGATVQRLLAAKRSSTSRSTGNQAMILTREELAFLDAYCHEGTEPPFGGPATEAMASLGVYSGDTLNLQWAFLRQASDWPGHRKRRRGCAAAPLARS